MPLSVWLGCQDSNLGMAESKSAAFPLGYAAKGRLARAGAAEGPRNGRAGAA